MRFFFGPLAFCLACCFPPGAACGILGTKGKIRYGWYAYESEVEPMKLLYAEDEGAAPAQKAALSLSGLAEQTLEPFLQPMEAQGITLERDIQPEVSLTADPTQLEQLLSLLLDNAVKYTGPGGRIRLSVKQEGKRARLCLENTCPQLPTVPPEKLFDRFYRGTPPAPRRRAAMALAWRWPAPWPRQTRAACTPSTFRPKPSGLWRNSPTEHTRTDRGLRPVFFSSKLWLRFGSVYWAAHTERS